MTDEHDGRAEGEEAPSGAEHRHRMRHDWQNLIEDLIEDGRQRGLFEGLTGQGRPLELGGNVYEGNSALANRLLKDNDVRPLWLAQRVTVLESIDRLRAEIAREWERYRLAFDYAEGETQRGGLTIGWDDLCRRWDAAIVKLNKEIETYNLKRPMSQLEIFKLRLPDELKRVDAPRYLL